jgi:hypothetical protein
LFLADRSRNRLSGSTLEVSSIFKWYREDFEGGWRGASTLGHFLSLYAENLGLSEKDAVALRSGAMKVNYLDYDWRLNDVIR